jgi:hypothetical protein
MTSKFRTVAPLHRCVRRLWNTEFVRTFVVTSVQVFTCLALVEAIKLKAKCR